MQDTLEFRNAVSFGRDGDVTEICPHHGELLRRPPMTEREGQIWAAEDGLLLCQCPDCCKNIIRNSGVEMEQEKAMLTVWGGFVHGHWESPQEYFTSLGKGEATDDGVEFEESVPTDRFPAYLQERLTDTDSGSES